MARDTMTNLVERIRRQLASTVRMEINVLGASLNTTETTVTFTYDLENSLRSGSVISIGAELMRVVTVDVVAKEAVVIRGWQDSDATTHDTGTEALINPRFTQFDIFDAVIAEIDSWDPDLFTVDYIEATTTDNVETYELPSTYANAIGVISVQGNATDRDSTSWPALEYRLQRGPTTWTATTDTTSGLLIRFTDNLGYLREGKALIELAIPFDTSTITATTDLSTIGVTGSLLELIELGVKARLLSDDESGRSARNAQDEPRRNDEVAPGQALSAGQQAGRRHEARRGREVRKLRTRYPITQW